MKFGVNRSMFTSVLNHCIQDTLSSRAWPSGGRVREQRNLAYKLNHSNLEFQDFSEKAQAVDFTMDRRILER